MKLDITLRDNEGYSKNGYKVKSRVYIFPKNESVLDQFINRRSRPLNVYRDILRQGLSSIGIDLNNISYKWSQKAGCPCGCSPGFIIDCFDKNIYKKDVYIDIESLH